MIIFFPVEFIAEVNEYICTGKWPENKGTLIMDATVAPADIKFPTDIDLLNQSREHLETAITMLYSKQWAEVYYSGALSVSAAERNR